MAAKDNRQENAPDREAYRASTKRALSALDNLRASLDDDQLASALEGLDETSASIAAKANEDQSFADSTVRAILAALPNADAALIDETNVVFAAGGVFFFARHANSTKLALPLAHALGADLFAALEEPLAKCHEGLAFRREVYHENRWFEAHGAPLKDLPRKAALLTLADVTGRKSAEESKRKFREEADRFRDLLARRADELLRLEEKLVESERLRRDLDLEKDKFFSIVAHDIRTPLSTMLGYSEILAFESAGFTREKIVSLALKMYGAVVNAAEMIDNLLDWARVRTGKLVPREEAIAVNYLFAKEAERFADAAKKKNVTPRREAPEGLRARADSYLFSKIVRNLLSNAIKYSSAGDTVELRAKASDGMVVVEVADRGAGMSAETVKKLFRLDARLATEGTAGERGAGIGLLVCREFAKKMGGEIEVESERGVGSVFRFRVPLAE